MTATIENVKTLDPAMYQAMPDELLIAQQFTQQGAVHAVGFLLQNGCNEETATEMLASLREQAKLIREESARRGIVLFEHDQTSFN